LLTRSALRLLRESLGRLAGPQRAALLGEPALRPLVAAALAEDDRLLPVGEVALADPATVLEALAACEAEVVLLAVPLAEDDPLVPALLGRGYRLRRVAVVVD